MTYAKRLYKLIAVGTILLWVCVACGLGGGSESTTPATDTPAAASVPVAKPSESVAQPAATAAAQPPSVAATQPPAVAATQPPAALGTGTLRLDKTTFAPLEEIQVHFTTSVAFPDDAWMGIIPSDVPHGSETTNDEHDLDYQYLNGQTSGTMIFIAPERPGSYDFRLHDTDSEGQEVASVTFVISGGAEQPALWLDRADYVIGEEIQVHFTAPATFPTNAWVGLLPSDVPHGSEDTNDEYDLDYQYLDGRSSGALTFNAPLTPGSYDFRMHDTVSGGQEVASVSFTAGASSVQPALWLDKTSFAPGEEIQVHFAAPPTYPTNAWVGLIPSDVPHGSGDTNDEYDLDYEYLDGRASGVMIFAAPPDPGSYDFRMQDASSDSREVASVTFQVK